MDARQETITADPKDLLQDYPECLIINRPDLKSKPLILGEQILTIIFWGFWFYLWLPLISVLAWLLGFHVLYSHIVVLGGFEGFLRQLNVFCAGIVVASALLALWSFYNLKRYGELNRRTGILVTDSEALKKTFSLSDAQLHLMQQAKHASVAFAPDGRIADVSA